MTALTEALSHHPVHWLSLSKLFHALRVNFGTLRISSGSRSVRNLSCADSLRWTLEKCLRGVIRRDVGSSWHLGLGNPTWVLEVLRELPAQGAQRTRCPFCTCHSPACGYFQSQPRTHIHMWRMLRETMPQATSLWMSHQSGLRQTSGSMADMSTVVLQRERTWVKHEAMGPRNELPFVLNEDHR